MARDSGVSCFTCLADLRNEGVARMLGTGFLFFMDRHTLSLIPTPCAERNTFN